MTAKRYFKVNKQLLTCLITVTILTVLLRESYLHFTLDLTKFTSIGTSVASFTYNRIEKSKINHKDLTNSTNIWSSLSINILSQKFRHLKLSTTPANSEITSIAHAPINNRVDAKNETYVSFDEFEEREKQLDLYKVYARTIGEDEFLASIRFKKWGENCILPVLEPNHPGLRAQIRLYRGDAIFPCRSDKTTLVRFENGVLMLDDEAVISNSLDGKPHIRCFYRPIHRNVSHSDPDNNIYLGKATQITEFVRPKDNEEFLYAYCQDMSGELVHEDIISRIIYKPPRKPAYTNKVPHNQNSDKLLEGKSQGISKNKPNIVDLPKLNILMLGIDSVSRVNYHRQLRRTEEYLANHFASVEFQAHHKVGENTLPNLIVMLMGMYFPRLACGNKSENECNPTQVTLPFDRHEEEIVWRDFQRTGYSTLFAEDTAQQGLFRRYRRMGFTRPPVDYYYRPMSIHIRQWQLKVLDRFCAFGDMEPINLLAWVQDFANRMAEWKHPYFGFTFTNKITHMRTTYLGYLDLPYRDLIKNITESGALNNTLLIMFSDHGNRLDSFRKTFHGSFEEKLPLLKFVFPKWFPTAYPQAWKTLNANSKILTSHFDTYHTLRHLAHSTETWPSININDIYAAPKVKYDPGIVSQSLFLPLNPHRTCKEAGVPLHFCACNVNKILSRKDRKIKEFGKLIVKHINEKIVNYSDLCVPWKYRKIQAAKMGLNVPKNSKRKNYPFLPTDSYQLVSSNAIDSAEPLIYQPEQIEDVANIQNRVARDASGSSDLKDVLTKRNNDKTGSAIYIINLALSPQNALFEATLLVKNGEILNIEDVTRVSVYGDQAWCIKNYQIEPFCFCKYPKP